MKNQNLFIFASIAFTAILISCFSDIESLPATWEEYVAQSKNSSSSKKQQYCIYEGISECYELEGDFCPFGGEKSEECPFFADGSSSSGESLPEYNYCVFSSIEECLGGHPTVSVCPHGGKLSNTCPYSSSSGSSSSNGVPAPILSAAGSIAFTGLNTVANPEGKYYFIGDKVGVTNTFTVTNAAAAKCGTNAIATEFSAQEGVIDYDDDGDIIVKGAGDIAAIPIITCNGAKHRFTKESIITTSVPNPAIGDCVYGNNFFRYMAVSETVAANVPITNNYDRCVVETNVIGGEDYHDSYALVLADVGNKNPTAKVTCNGILTIKNCPALTVAENYFKFPNLDVKYSILSGTTVIELLDSYGGKQADKFGCGDAAAGFDFWFNNNSESIRDKFNNNDIEGNTNAYWFETTLPSYAENGNRIFLRATDEMQCLVAVW